MLGSEQEVSISHVSDSTCCKHESKIENLFDDD